jgi:hypothetical protein
MHGCRLDVSHGVVSALAYRCVCCLHYIRIYMHTLSVRRGPCACVLTSTYYVFWQYLSKSIQTTDAVHRLTTYSREFTTNASLFRDRGIVTKAWKEPGRQSIHGRNVVIWLATTSLHTHNSGSQGKDAIQLLQYQRKQ